MRSSGRLPSVEEVVEVIVRRMILDGQTDPHYYARNILPEDYERIVSRYEKRTSVLSSTDEQIAEGVIVLGRRHEKGPARPSYAPPWDRDKKERVRLMLEDGASHREIERTLKVSHGSVARHFPGTAWTPSQAGKYSAETRYIRAEGKRNGVEL